MGISPLMLLRGCLLYVLFAVAFAAELSPIEAEIERLYVEHTNSEEFAELAPIKALGDRARDGSIRDQRAYWFALCVMHAQQEQKTDAQAALDALSVLTAKDSDVSLQADRLVCQSHLAELDHRNSEAYRLREEAFTMSKEGGDGFARYRAGTAFASSAGRKGHYDKALLALQSAFRGAEMLGDLSRQVNVQSSMAWTQYQLGQAEAALATYANAKKLATEHDLRRALLWIYNDEAVVLTTLGRLDEAQALHEQVLADSEKFDSLNGILTAYINLSDIQLRKHNYAEAERLALIGLQKAPTDKLEENRLTLQANLAYALAGEKQLRRARPIIEEVIQYYQQRAFPADEAAIWQEWGNALELNEEYREALTAFHHYERLMAEVNKKDREKAILELQQQFETEQQAKEIELLTKSNALKDVELINNQLQKKIWWLLALLLIALLFVMAMFFQRVRAANQQLEQKNRELDYQSTRDPLTALYNRRYFQQLISNVDLNQSERRNPHAGEELTRAIYLLDIDHFKRINDKFGHAAGDTVLRIMADRLREGLRENDVIVRWGGEEFLVFAQQLPMHMVQPLAQRILDLFAQEPIKHEQHTIPVSCSVGYSLLPLKVGSEQILSWERAVNVVDMALYLAKAHGRNRAYGITSINSDQEDPLSTVERDLETAWQSGIVNMQITLGPERDNDVLLHPSQH